MKQIFVSVLLAVGLATNAQSIPKFLNSSTTTTFAVNSKEDVKHIVHPGTVSPDEMYSYIDNGLIDDEKYLYYINRKGTLVIGVPSNFKSVAYVISICDYEPQGGWGSDQYINYMKILCNCD